MPTRREFLAGAVALVAAACTGGSKKVTPSESPSSIGSLLQGADQQLSLIQAQSSLDVGKSRFTFGLSTASGGLLQGGAPEVFLARDQSSQPMGPFHSAFYQLTAYEKTGDRSPRTPITGYYTTVLKVPSAGTWAVAAVAKAPSGEGVGVAALKAETNPPNGIGDHAISVRTPVATTEHGIREICTRTPPDPMHYVSLADALTSGKPTVVVFATPALCESRFCGPIVDENLLVFRSVGRQRANFIHVEEFLPGKDLKPPPAFAKNRSPAFKAWHLVTEPWTFVIDRAGIIRARFEGPVAAPQIEQALRPLL